MKRRVEIGLLYSQSGSYRRISNSSRAGALRAIADVNSDSAGSVHFVPIERDPEGNVDRYPILCADILRNSNARHIFGTATSWSRKESIPVVEKLDGTLWYGCPYEGFESNDHIVYLHASPSQHLLPLLSYAIPRHGANGFLVGSNYIWGWETNRVARDLILDAGGQVRGERYLPIDDVQVDRLLREIEAARPDFVLNNLVGESSYAFYRGYAALAAQNDHFRPRTCPILSCNLTECELPALGDDAVGHLSVGPYFKSLSERPTATGSPVMLDDSFQAAAYAGVQMLARILHVKPEANWADLPALFAQMVFPTAIGMLSLDPHTQHATLPAIIGRVGRAGFEVIEQHWDVAPDPYLSHAIRDRTSASPPRLRVVS